MGKPCVFLDRDGCVSVEAGYVNHPARIHPERGSAAAIRRLNDAGVLAILATNQAGVARGYFTEDTLKQVHRRLEELIWDEARAKLDGLYYCPFHPDGTVPEYSVTSHLRKPEPGMIELACEEHDIDLSRSYMVGDKITDVYFGHKVGCKSVMVMTGYGLGEWEHQREMFKEQPDHRADNLYMAVDWILKDLGVKPPIL